MRGSTAEGTTFPGKTHDDPHPGAHLFDSEPLRLRANLSRVRNDSLIMQASRSLHSVACKDRFGLILLRRPIGRRLAPRNRGAVRIIRCVVEIPGASRGLSAGKHPTRAKEPLSNRGARPSRAAIPLISCVRPLRAREPKADPQDRGPLSGSSVLPVE